MLRPYPDFDLPNMGARLSDIVNVCVRYCRLVHCLISKGLFSRHDVTFTKINCKELRLEDYSRLPSWLRHFVQVDVKCDRIHLDSIEMIRSRFVNGSPTAIRVAQAL